MGYLGAGVFFFSKGNSVFFCLALLRFSSIFKKKKVDISTFEGINNLMTIVELLSFSHSLKVFDMPN